MKDTLIFVVATSVPGIAIAAGGIGASPHNQMMPGTPQLAALLDGYPTRPPWPVAGVDYPVGVPEGVTLKDPTISSSLPRGTTLDAQNHILRVTESGVSLIGYDFSLHGGWGVYIPAGVTDTVIQGSRFVVGPNNRVPLNASAGSGNLTVQRDTFDGAGGDGQVWALVNYNGSGRFVAKYNLFQNAPNDAVDFNAGSMTTIVEHNAFSNLGAAPGSHPDSVQYVSADAHNSIIAFNTIYQPNPSGMQGIQISGSNGSRQINTTVRNNVIISKGPRKTMSYSIAVVQSSGNTIDGVLVRDNYIDYSGAYGPFYRPSGINVVFDHDIDLNTGNVIPNPLLK
jgi:hypothetical protein